MGRTKLVPDALKKTGLITVSTRYVIAPNPEVDIPPVPNPDGAWREERSFATTAMKPRNMARIMERERMTLDVIAHDRSKVSDPLSSAVYHPIKGYRPIGPIVDPASLGHTRAVRVIPPWRPSAAKLAQIRALAEMTPLGGQFSKLSCEIRTARELLAEYDTREQRAIEAANREVVKAHDRRMEEYMTRLAAVPLYDAIGLMPNGEPPVIEWTLATIPAPDGLGRIVTCQRVKPLTAIPNPNPPATGRDWVASSRLFANRTAKLSQLVPLASKGAARG